MNFFPVSDSTLASGHIAAFVKEKYQLAGLVAARILKTGINHSYLISGESQQFVFRVYSLNWRTYIEIAEEIRLLNLLKEKDLPVSYPIADAQSVYIQQLQAPEGPRYGVLFSFAKGDKMLNFPAALHYQMGQVMARLHKITHNLPLERVDYTPEILLNQSFEQLKNFLPADTEEMLYMKSLQIALHRIFNKADKHSLRQGAVHLDIWFDNFVIDSNNNITLFDFDFCGNGWQLLDIAYYILQVYSTEKDEAEFNSKKESFLQGYQSVSIISQDEMELIPAAGASIYFFYLGIQCSRYDNWSNNFLNTIYLKRFINLLIKKWVNFHGLPVS